MTRIASLCDAQTHLATLADTAVAGETIVIASNGVPQARTVVPASYRTHRELANAMRIRRVSAGYDPQKPAVVRSFEGCH